MSEDSVLLIDSPLLPDPDAEEELGPTDIEAIADEDLRGSRLLLVRRFVKSIDIEGVKGGIIQFVCTFQPAQGARFSSAQFRLRLLTPTGIKLIDLAPRIIEDPHPVEVTCDNKGKLGFQLPVINGVAEDSISKKYAIYHCKVQGAGEGTSLARWDFREHPDKRDGIGQEHVLTLTLPVTGQVSGSVIVSARLVRSGLGGSIEAIRDMILGPKPNERSYPITFEILEGCQ